MSNVLIVSYCWTQDAERLGALIHGDGTADQQLIDVVFRDLATVHDVAVDWLYTFYSTGNYFAWDWLHDPLTMGLSFLSELFNHFSNHYFRWVCILWSRLLFIPRYLLSNAFACRKLQTILCW